MDKKDYTIEELNTIKLCDDCGEHLKCGEVERGVCSKCSEANAKRMRIQRDLAEMRDRHRLQERYMWSTRIMYSSTTGSSYF